MKATDLLGLAGLVVRAVAVAGVAGAASIGVGVVVVAVAVASTIVATVVVVATCWTSPSSSIGHIELLSLSPSESNSIDVCVILLRREEGLTELCCRWS